MPVCAAITSVYGSSIKPGGLEVWNLEGGIDAWSTQVDDTVPRY